jgi:hypothetical protein
MYSIKLLAVITETECLYFTAQCQLNLQVSQVDLVVSCQAR